MYSHVGERLRGAVSDLVGRENQRERLRKAWVFHLSSLVAETDVPPWFPGEFAKFCADLTRESARGDEGSVAATLDVIDDEEAEGLAQRVVDLYERVAREPGALH